MGFWAQVERWKTPLLKIFVVKIATLTLYSLFSQKQQHNNPTTRDIKRLPTQTHFVAPLLPYYYENKLLTLLMTRTQGQDKVGGGPRGED